MFQHNQQQLATTRCSHTLIQSAQKSEEGHNCGHESESECVRQPVTAASSDDWLPHSYSPPQPQRQRQGQSQSQLQLQPTSSGSRFLTPINTMDGKQRTERNLVNRYRAYVAPQPETLPPLSYFNSANLHSALYYTCNISDFSQVILKRKRELGKGVRF